MYEVAPVAGNKVEAACALRSLQQIMGQISSSHGSGGKKSSKYRSSAVPSGARIKDDIYREHLYNKGKDSVRVKEMSGRPVTISEMNAYNIEKDKDKLPVDQEILRNSMQPNHREFFSVGEGYHKTDNCYYKTPDGGYHKLPQDSFHKTSEGCYVKLADGSFRRLDEVKAVAKEAAGSGDSSVSSQSRYKNQMMRFLRRSKSHTPGTIKEMQKEKAVAQNVNTTAGNQNRRVMVTMMDGGLPVVATSKQPDYHRPTKVKERSKDAKGKELKHKVKIKRNLIYICRHLIKMQRG
ncbi:uncharacterized protein LOC132256162 [Phlebotomus argentipes]|uniref:uncharacterized protein LOC132256162 n=1 Tax=Phlebotomus argentipes TaxID=94469 RepID=UPI002892DCE8|nr:uncharacterized protein LOC132256162 [Phlebotomus argentipes]